MDAKKLSKIIELVRNYKKIQEDAAPTMNLGAGQISGTVEAGDNPPIFNKKKRYIYGGKGSRKMWITQKYK
jgi:hypothetical protein